MSDYHWNYRFIHLAGHIAGWSKDPSTKCGAVIVRPDKTIASMGFNGLPQGIEDNPEILTNREAKLDRVVHAEMNALLFLRERAAGYSMYVWPSLPCNRCAAHIIQSGVKKVYFPDIPMLHWTTAMGISRQLFAEAGVEMECIFISEGQGTDKQLALL
jgi:dCMP deaminase